MSLMGEASEVRYLVFLSMILLMVSNTSYPIFLAVLIKVSFLTPGKVISLTFVTVLYGYNGLHTSHVNLVYILWPET